MADGIQAENNIAPEFFYTTQEQETIALERADVVWAIKHHEQLFFESLTSKAIVKTLIHVDMEKPQQPTATHFKQGYLRLGIIGARNNINLTNTRNFIERAAPIFKRYLAPIKIVVAGSMCQDLDDINSPWVEKLGFVDSVSEFYNDVDAVVVPMTFSTGLKIKVAEALNYGAALICHEHASEGFPVDHAWHKMTSLDDIAMACVELAYSPELLGGLYLASRQAQLRSQDLFEATIVSSLEKTREHRVTTVFVIPVNELTPSGLLNFKLKELLSYMPWATRPLLYLQGDFGETELSILKQFSESAKIFTSSTSLFSGWIHHAESLNHLVDEWSCDVVWLMGGVASEPLDNTRNSPEILLDTEVMGVSAAKGIYHDAGLQRTLLISNSCRTSSLNSEDNVLVLPAMYHNRAAKLPFDYLSCKNYGAIVILFSGATEYLKYLMHVVDTLTGREDKVCWLVNDPNTQSYMAHNNVQSLLLSDVNRDMTLLPRYIGLSIVSDEGQCFSWLQEALIKASVPRLSTCAEEHESLLEFVAHFNRLKSADDNVDFQGDTRFTDDAGWSALWGKYTKSLANTKKLHNAIRQFV